MTDQNLTSDAGTAKSRSGLTLVAVSSGLSRMLGVQFNAVMHSFDMQGTPINLRMFIDGIPQAQSVDLGTHTLIPNGAPLDLAPGQHSLTLPNSPYDYSVNNINHQLQLNLLSSGGSNVLRVTGSVESSWTIGAIDMELLDPVFIER